MPVPNYMQGRSLVAVLKGETPKDWTDVAYHRYWQNQAETHNAYAHYGILTKDLKLIYRYNEDLQ